MSDQNTSDAYRHISNSPMDEGSSETAPGCVADTEEPFVFRAKSVEAFPPKKNGWFNKEKRENRRKRKTQQATITLVEGTAQIQVTRPLWEELDRRLATLDMFQTGKNELDLNRVAEPEPQLLPLYQEQPIAPILMYLEPNQENPLPILAINPNEIPRLPAPNPPEQWWTNDLAFQDPMNDPYPYMPYGKLIPAYNKPIPMTLRVFLHISFMLKLWEIIK
ncbi:hypothetical protein Hanom_Chr11g01041611 [Helianthus anomalus]